MKTVPGQRNLLDGTNGRLNTEEKKKLVNLKQ